MLLQLAVSKSGGIAGTYYHAMTGNSQPVHGAVDLKTQQVAWQIGDEVTYCLEGSVFIAGAIVQWLRDGLEIIESSAEIEELAKQVQDSGGVVIVPAFVGLGAPYWNQDARGIIIGLTRGTKREHLARAALDSMAYQSYDLLQAMNEESGLPLTELKVDGGASVNDLMMQFQADLLDVTVRRPKVPETTALGAAYLAGLAVGYWKSQEELSNLWELDAEFQPQMQAAERERLMTQWHRAVERSLDWNQSS